MTRKELVDLLVANYAEDDEVYVSYEDEHGECVDTAKGVGEVTQTPCNGHYEVRNGEEWTRLAEGDSIWNYSRECVRYVTDERREVTRKCILV